MKLIFYILKMNKNLNIDNEKISHMAMIKKVNEEADEVIRAIKIYSSNRTMANLSEVVKETFDLIQVCILILFRANKVADRIGDDYFMKEINNEHNNKLLIERKWIAETSISVEVKE